jgi:hypothetical protein
MKIELLRERYHQQLCQDIIRIYRKQNQDGYPNFADGSNTSSVAIAWQIFKQLGCSISHERLSGQTVGGRFETITKDFLQDAFQLLQHARPGRWSYDTTQTDISNYYQYEHLADLAEVVAENRLLATTLGGDYIVKPDIIIGRYPLTEDELNPDAQEPLVARVATLTPLREKNQTEQRLLLHASISCKWTIRSDRSQNTRTEALNLIRNRKGPLPHVVAVTAEPLPTRLAALALGTGDLDCVYHIALPELQEALVQVNNLDQLDMLEMMVSGRRLHDIADLPFDLAI